MSVEILEKTLEEIVDIFLAEVKLPRPNGWGGSDDAALKRRCLSAFLSAVNRITPVQTVMGFRVSPLQDKGNV